jgi:hypothetical protein
LKQALSNDRAARPKTIPIAWKVPDDEHPEEIEVLGIASRKTLSAISGGVRTEWLGQPVMKRAPMHRDTEVTASITPPRAYWIPAAWRTIIEKIALHGIAFETISAPRDVDVTMVRFGEPKYETSQFEGHVRVTAPTTLEKRKEHFPAGSIRIATDQPLGTLAALLLEPASPDSFFQWGFFESILAPTEYVEGYIMEPMAEKMLAEDPKLAAEFQAKIASDAAFGGSPSARLQWLYERTPWYDERAMLYPVGREEQ